MSQTRKLYEQTGKQEVKGGDGTFFDAKGAGRAVVTSLELFLGEGDVPKLAIRVMVVSSSNPQGLPAGARKVQILNVFHSETKKRTMARGDMKRIVCALEGIDLDSPNAQGDAFAALCDKWINDKTARENPPNLEAVGALLDFESVERLTDKDGEPLAKPFYYPRFTHAKQTAAERAAMRAQLSNHELDSEG